MTARTFRVGLDYGTSASKLVFRDFQAPGGEKAFVIKYQNSFRIPSAVGVSRDEMIFGLTPCGIDEKSASNWHESLKMRFAQECKGGSGGYCHGPQKQLPTGFTAGDLISLSIWFLLSVANEAIQQYLPERASARVAFTLGIPTDFYDDREIREGFLRVAQTGWTLYQKGPFISGRIAQNQAKDALTEATARVLQSSPISADAMRDWIRTEAEASLLWPFQSPMVAEGPYAKIDVGAGTTNASVFRIAGESSTGTWLKDRVVFFGTCSQPIGMDALDRALFDSIGNRGENWLSLRGTEDSLLQNQRITRAIRSVIDSIQSAYYVAWQRALPKLNSAAELHAWRDHRIFLIGGGSRVTLLKEYLRRSPISESLRHPSVELLHPADLRMLDGTSVPASELPFLMVAHGLSNPALSIPPAEQPSAVKPMETRELAPKRQKWDKESWYDLDL